MHITRKGYGAFGVSLITVLAAALPARADTETPGPSDTVFINGQVVPPFPMFDTVPPQPGSQFAPAFFQAPAGIPNLGVVFLQDATSGIVSDQLWTQNGFFYFASDPDLQNLQALNVQVVDTLVETGTPQDVSGIFGLPAGSVLVQSDVPEPASLCLLSMGTLGLLARRRRA